MKPLTTLELLSYLRSLDIRLWIDGERLRYSSPPGILTPALKAQITERRAEILDFLRQASAASQDGTLSLLPLARPENLPLSFAQQRLWFLNQLEPNTPRYNEAFAMQISGALDQDILEQCLAAMIRRHEVLRTVFVEKDGQPFQVIRPAADFQLPVLDLRREGGDLSESDSLADVLSAETQRPFDLAHGPLFRITLLRLNDLEHVLLVVIHHIIWDEWSLGVFLKELSALYSKKVHLPDLAIQYADFAIWQREWLLGDRMETQLAYWKQHLGGELPVLALPTDRPRLPAPGHQGASYEFMIPQAVTQDLKTLAHQEKSTLFMILLGAFYVLLYRYTGQTDLLVGSPTANRRRSEVENLIGFFVNTLVLRGDLSGNPTFIDLLRRVRQVTLQAFDNQDVPFEKLVEALQPERNLSNPPLFQTMFALQNIELDWHIAGLGCRRVEIETRVSKFDLSLDIMETETGLTGVLEYSRNLFDAATITRLAGHFQTLLAGIVADPYQRIAHLPLLLGNELQQVVEGYNQTQAVYPQEYCLHELFEAQAARSPDSVAVIYEGRQLTYRQLNCQANQLARYLAKLGVGPEKLVGICMERSLELVVGILGTLKAGGAYLPLDPSYPLERLAFMLEDSQAVVVLSQHSLGIDFSGYAGEIVYLDDGVEGLSDQEDANLGQPMDPDHAAYLLYTSGSTGKPKGTLITHRAICNHMMWHQDEIHLETGDAVLQVSSFSFDASVCEFYAALLVGGRLVMARPGAQMDGGYLVKVINQEKVHLMLGVPVFLQMLLQEPGFEKCRSLKWVVSGGDVLSAELAERFHTSMPWVKFYNTYGPTEATIDTSFWLYKPLDAWQTAPIGRPISNLYTYVLDQQMQPVPVGVSGELYIGGIGLARGYINRPGLTSERFVPDPFGAHAGERLYRTGDLVRYLSDGNLEFLGRIDQQVKMRGFRIELGEIEAVMSKYPGIREVVVKLWTVEQQGQRLAAYYTVDSITEVFPNLLREFLRGKLPDYMVPAVFIRLEHMPLMPSGKIDRKALPRPEIPRSDLEENYTIPRNDIEEVLANVWAEVLKLERVGIYDNFFQLGGHSLLVMQVIARLRDALKVDLPVRALFDAPTIAGLAERVEVLHRAERDSQLFTGDGTARLLEGRL